MENPMHVRSPPPNSHPARTHRSGGKPSHALCMARAPRVGQLSRRNRLSFLFSETHVSTTLKIEPHSAHVRSALLSSPSQPLQQPPPPAVPRQQPRRARARRRYCAVPLHAAQHGGHASLVAQPPSTSARSPSSPARSPPRRRR